MQYFTAPVERGDVRDVIEATGTINPVITVQVGSQVSGTIASLAADFNSRVRKGEVIARIDPSLLEGALHVALADSENAEAGLTVARADLGRATAMLVQARLDFDRNESLAKEHAITDQQLETARATFDGAQASVEGAKAAVLQAQAQLSQKEAAVSVARTNLYHSVIRSPINGTVVARNVDVGQTVAASLQAPTVFTIAQDLTKMLVYAKVDESDVGVMKVNRPVTFKVDAFPDDLFHGTVSQVRMNATTIQNVVTYDVIISFSNRDLKLFPGMTAYVTIPVATATDVIKLPNAALRYRPAMSPSEIARLFRQYGLPENGTSDTGRRAALRSGDAVSGSVAPAPDSVATVWKLGDGGVEPVAVTLGITDHAYTEVRSVIGGHLAVGDNVVTGALAASSAGGPLAGTRR